jgi:hypothetical protein
MPILNFIYICSKIINMIEVLGRQIANKMNEITVEEFEKISAIHNDSELDNVEKHIRVFEVVGIDEEEWDDFNYFVEKTREFNNDNYEKKEPIGEIEIDGYTYKAELKLSVKDTKLIEKLINKTNKHNVADILAIMFKRTDLSNTEHYADAHLKHKAKLFRMQPAEIAIPYITFVTETISNHANKQASDKVESNND